MNRGTDDNINRKTTFPRWQLVDKDGKWCRSALGMILWWHEDFPCEWRHVESAVAIRKIVAPGLARMVWTGTLEDRGEGHIGIAEVRMNGLGRFVGKRVVITVKVLP